MVVKGLVGSALTGAVAHRLVKNVSRLPTLTAEIFIPWELYLKHDNQGLFNCSMSHSTLSQQ